MFKKLPRGARRANRPLEAHGPIFLSSRTCAGRARGACMTSTRRRKAPLAPGAGISTRSSRGSHPYRLFHSPLFLSPLSPSRLDLRANATAQAGGTADSWAVLRSRLRASASPLLRRGTRQLAARAPLAGLPPRVTRAHDAGVHLCQRPRRTRLGPAGGWGAIEMDRWKIKTRGPAVKHHRSHASHHTLC